MLTLLHHYHMTGIKYQYLLVEEDAKSRVLENSKLVCKLIYLLENTSL